MALIKKAKVEADLVRKVQVVGPTSAFGELTSVQSTPSLSAFLSSFNDTRVWNKYTAGGGTVSLVTGSTAMVQMASTSTVGSYATLQTAARMPYTAGRGMTYRWTAQFGTPVAGGQTLTGPYHSEDGVYVGYNGTSFVFGHRYLRKLEIQRLRLTVGTTGAENLTITLGGNANSVPGITAATTTALARAIAESGVTFSDGTFTWIPYAVESDVYFVRQYHTDATGTMSFASSGAAAGTFTETQAGATGTSDEVAQADWNIDPFDGTGGSGMTLDPSMINIYQITMGWLGAANIILNIYNPDDGRFYPAHRIKWANVNTTPWAEDPRFPIAYAAFNAGAASGVTCSGASCAGLTEGPDLYLGPPWAIGRKKTGIGTTEVPIIAIQTAPVDIERSRINKRRLNIEYVSITNSGTKDATIKMYIADPSVLTGYSFVQDDDSSILWYDITSTAITTTNAALAYNIGIPGGTVVNVPAPKNLPYGVERGVCFIVTGVTDASTTDIEVGLSGREDS